MSFPQIVESYVSGTSGYFIWSNGFKEQWGVTSNTGTSNYTVTLLKNFSNTNYFVALTGTANMSGHIIYVTSKTTSNFTGYATKNSYWYACGY